MATAVSTIEECDVAILGRLVRPEDGSLSVAAARSLLKITFEQRDIDRMNDLAQRSRDGKLTPAEHTEITEYARVSHLLAVLHLKARVSLKKRGVRA